MKQEGARRFTLDDLLPAVLALLALVLGIVVFVSFMVPYSVQVGYDEGYEAAGVERIIDGRGLPYVDAVSIRGPFLYWTLAIAQLVSGRFQWTGTRLTGLLSCAVVVASCFFAGWAARWALAGAVGAAIYVFVIALYYAPGGGIGVHAEPVAIAYLTAALFFVAYALYRARTARRRMILLAVGGVLVATAALTKQTIALCAFAFLFWIVARGSVDAAQGSPDKPAPWRPVLVGWALPFVAGGCALVALVLLRYALAGELHAFFYWSVGVGAKIYMAPFKGQVAALLGDWFINEPWAILGTALALAIGLGVPLGRVTGPTPRAVLAAFGDAGFETVVGLTGPILMVVAALPHRMWPHYFVPVWAFFGLVLGILIERVAVRGAARPRVAQAAVVLIVGTILMISAVSRIRSLGREYAQGSWHNPRPDGLCEEIDRIAGPGREPIFIWGLDGDLYITCRRRCASMYTHTTLIMGMTPPFWNVDPSRIPEGSRERLLADLTGKPPKVIIDNEIEGPGTRMVDVPMYGDFIRARYCELGVVPDRSGRPLHLFARRDLEACSGR